MGKALIPLLGGLDSAEYRSSTSLKGADNFAFLFPLSHADGRVFDTF